MIEIGSVKYTPKEFVLEIKDKFGNVKAKYAINDKDKYVEKLMDEHFVELSFELDRFEAFLRADYILFEGSKFLLRKDVTPVKLNEHRFKYKLKFESEEMLLKDADFYYLRQDLKEASFNLTTDADSFMQIVVDNANRYFNKDKYKVGVIQPEGIYHIFFDKIKTYDALIEIAKVFEAEFLFDKDYNVHLLNKANISEEIELKTDVSIAKLEYAETTPNIPFNRIVSLGSTHNIDANYRTPENNEGVDAIYQKRLRIPTSKGEYIDAKENMSPEEVVEGVVVFDHIFPKRIGVVSNISTKEYTDTDEITGAKIKWNAYRYKDNDLLFKEEYLLEGAELRIVFKSGHLNGMDFAVRFNPDKYKEDNPKSQVFEIIRNEDYAIPLPNDKLCPQEGDTYILYGFDINLVNDKYIPEAEEELYEAAKKWLSDNFKDTKVYECPTIVKYFHDHNLDLGLGQRIKLVDSSLENGSRSSRIIGFEKKLINKYNAIYTIGDNIRYSNLSNLKEEVKNLKADQYYIAHEASNKTPVITQYDTVKPTDRNVYSALMSLRTFHRKDITDETDHLQKYNKGIEVGQYGKKKGAYINEEGIGDFEKVVSKDTDFKRMDADDVVTNTASINELITKLAKIHKLEVTDTATILKAVVKEYLSSEKFVSGFAGEGFRISQAINGDWNLEIDNLIVRKLFNVFELLVQEIKHQGGMQLYSPAGGKITKVTDGGSYWKCEIESADTFFKDDLVICQKFTGVIKRYWRAVTSVGTGYINLSKSDCETGSSIPEIGDEIAVQGNKTNTSRQSVYIVSVVGADAPYTAYYSGINSYSLKDKLVTREGNLNGIIDKDFGQLKGYGLYANNAYLKGILRLTNGKTVEQELLTTNNNVEANRLELGGQIDEVKQDSKQQIDSIRTDFDVIEGQINMNVAETQRLVSMSNAQVTEATEASNKAQQNADLANKKALEAQANADKTKADATASNQAKIDTQKKADEAKLQADKANQEAIKSKNDADKAKAAKEASEGVLQSVTEKEASINVTAGQVDIKAKEATESANRAVVAEANINTKADSIVMEASRQSAEKAIEGLDIGGRNILLDSDKGWVNSSYPTARIKFAEQLKDGEEFCVRIYGKLNENSSNHWHIYNSGGTVNVLIVPRSSYNKVGGYYEAVGKWRIGNSTNDAAYIYGIPNSKLENIIDKVIISRGNKATDWTRADEDYEAEFQATNSKLELLSDKFSVEVAKTDGTRKELTALTQDHDEFKVQVIKDIDGAIDTNNEVIKSEFVVNEKGLGFRGNEIDMTGRVTFTSLNAEAQGKIDDAKRTADNAAQDIWDFRTEAGDLAYVDEVSLAMLDETIIEGGFIKTSLIEANSITADKINVESLESIRIRTGNLEVLDGAMIGNFKIENGSIVAYKPDGSKDWGNLTISRDFFKVGNNESYVMEGDNVFPDSSPLFTCSSIICNTNYHDPTDFFFYQTKNIGLSIEVGKAEENIALNLTGGGISGFGLKVTYWTHANDNTVKDIDSYIIDTSGNSHKVFYVPHPKETWVGRVVIINNRGRRWLQAQAKSSSHSVSNIFRWGWNSSNSKWSLNDGQTGFMVNTGDFWQCSYMDWSNSQW